MFLHLCRQQSYVIPSSELSDHSIVSMKDGKMDIDRQRIDEWMDKWTVGYRAINSNYVQYILWSGIVIFYYLFSNLIMARKTMIWV